MVNMERRDEKRLVNSISSGAKASSCMLTRQVFSVGPIMININFALHGHSFGTEGLLGQKLCLKTIIRMHCNNAMDQFIQPQPYTRSNLLRGMSPDKHFNKNRL
uniref:Uncharacterized protein n=1 Tax=Romanomermis culicivorax TaxID=13658 RepID=A0A915K9V7_ROMCU